MPDSLNEKSDDELVYLIAVGNQVAFQCLFSRYMMDVYKLCYSLLMDQTFAEDATQETFVKLWRHAPSWQPDAPIKTWLMRVARNHCMDIFRKKKSDSKKIEAFHMDQKANDKSSVSYQNEQALDEEKFSKTIQKALFLLPERQREAVTLVYYTELPNIEAAEIMGMKAVAFDSLLARARRNLRESLSDQANLKGYLGYDTE